MPPRKPKEKLRPGAISPDAYEATFTDRQADDIAERVWRGEHGYSPKGKPSAIEWSGR